MWESEVARYRLTHLFRFRVLWIGAVLAGLAGGGLMIVSKLRVERYRAQILCQRVERAAAPGEAVFTDDRLTALILRRYGDSNLHGQLQSLAAEAVPARFLGSSQEVVLVLREGDPLRATLVSSGLTLTEAPGELRRTIYFAHR